MATGSTSWLEERIRETFRRLPLLEGITFDEQVTLVDVELAHCPGRHWSTDVHNEVTIEPLALMEDLQDVDASAALLKGRTFARTLH